MQPQPAELFYPESDGKPMSDNTLQAYWIIHLFTNLDDLLPDFVAADLMWYPVQGNNRLFLAPDVMVALGRPKGHRGSYQVWREADIQPQVAFEIRSPSNSDAEMARKLADYDRYGVQEYYNYDPDPAHNLLEVFIRRDGALRPVPVVGSFDSPLLGIRFLLRTPTLQLLHPDGSPFTSRNEERIRANAAQERAERLAARLRALGFSEE